jgi:hypothetical protein
MAIFTPAQNPRGLASKIFITVFSEPDRITQPEANRL